MEYEEAYKRIAKEIEKAKKDGTFDELTEHLEEQLGDSSKPDNEFTSGYIKIVLDGAEKSMDLYVMDINTTGYLKVEVGRRLNLYSKKLQIYEIDGITKDFGDDDFLGDLNIKEGSVVKLRYVDDNVVSDNSSDNNSSEREGNSVETKSCLICQVF